LTVARTDAYTRLCEQRIYVRLSNITISRPAFIIATRARAARHSTHNDNGAHIMLFMVQMQVNIPATLDKAVADQLKKDEKEMSQKLQREGKWRDLWRVVGQYANVSIFNVSGNDELHNILSALPLYPFMTISVTPLTQHPSAIAQIG
jgi:muconolactone D-isomerase